MGTLSGGSGALNPVARVSAFLSVLLASGAFAAPIPPPEELLPEDTLAVIAAPDFSRLRALLGQTPLARLWLDPAMQPFRDKFVERWQEEFAEPLERELNIRFADYTGLPQGQLTLAVTQNGWDGRSGVAPAFLLLLDARDQEQQLRQNLADVRQKWVAAGKLLRTEKIRGVEFVILTLSSNDVPRTLKNFTSDRSETFLPIVVERESRRPEAKRELLVGQFESLLILGSSPRAIEKVVACLTGGFVPVLADRAGFEADRLARFRDAPCFGWLDLRRLVEVLNKVPSPGTPPNRPRALDWKTLLAATGLSGLKTLSFSYNATSEGAMFEFALNVPEADRTGLTRMFAVERKDAAPPGFVPADAVKFQRLRLDGQRTWATLEKMASEISPAWAHVIAMLLQSADAAGREKAAGFDARKDLIAKLGDDLVTWEKLPRGTALDDLNTAPLLVLVGSPNAEKLVVSLGSLLATIPQVRPPEQRDFLGRKIYTATPPMFSPPDDPQGRMPSVHYAASGSYVGFSKDAALLEEWLRSGEKPPRALREVPGLTGAMQKVGGASQGWIGYENQAEFMRFIVAALKKDLAAATNAMLNAQLPAGLNFVTDGKGLPRWFDFALLPAWEDMARYFHYTVHGGGADAERLTYRYYYPTPPGLRE